MKNWQFCIIMCSIIFCSITTVNIATAGPLVDAARWTEKAATRVADSARDTYKRAPTADQVERQLRGAAASAKKKVHEVTK